MGAVTILLCSFAHIVSICTRLYLPDVSSASYFIILNQGQFNNSKHFTVSSKTCNAYNGSWPQFMVAVWFMNFRIVGNPGPKAFIIGEERGEGSYQTQCVRLV